MNNKNKIRGGAALVALAILGITVVIRHRLPNESGFHEQVVEAGSGPHVGSCPIFPADNVWNVPVDLLPKSAQSKSYIDTIGPKPLHADFGSNLGYGIPYSEIRPGTTRVPVKFDYSDDSDLGNYPIPADAPVEGNGNPDGDRHVILIDPRVCILYELFAAAKQSNGAWKAGSGIKMDLTSNALRTDGKTSADAAGLPIFPGLVRYDEVANGEIAHALRFTVPQTQATYIWPARHFASNRKGLNFPPLGTRFRLRADFDISGFSHQNQVILTALKHYGMFLADNGSAGFITGVSDRRWDDSDLHKLAAVKMQDFEAIDESMLQILADSGRVDPTVKLR